MMNRSWGPSPRRFDHRDRPTEQDDLSRKNSIQPQMNTDKHRWGKATRLLSGREGRSLKTDCLGNREFFILSLEYLCSSVSICGSYCMDTAKRPPRALMSDSQILCANSADRPFDSNGPESDRLYPILIGEPDGAECIGTDPA